MEAEDSGVTPPPPAQFGSRPWAAAARGGSCLALLLGVCLWSGGGVQRESQARSRPWVLPT